MSHLGVKDHDLLAEQWVMMPIKGTVLKFLGMWVLRSKKSYDAQPRKRFMSRGAQKCVQLL